MNFRESPPYYAYGLACLQFLIGGIYYTAAQKYANKVAPPTLVGTMTGMVGSVNWIISKGEVKRVLSRLLGWILKTQHLKEE